MHRALQVALKIFKWIAIVGISIYLALLLVNLRDEDLSPEERAIAAPNRPAVPNTQNVYIALIGFDAPAGVDPMEYGARRIAEHNEAATRDPWGIDRLAKRDDNQLVREGSVRLKWIDGGKKTPSSLDGSMLLEALGHSEDVKFLLGANSELIARYNSLQRLPFFSNTAAPDIFTSMLSSGTQSYARNSLLWQCAIDAQSGRLDRAMDFFATDIALWRRVLAGSGTLVDEMVAIAYLAADFHLLSDLIASPKFDARANSETLERLITPLTAVELEAGHMYAREFEINSVLLSAMRDEEKRQASESWLIRVQKSLFYWPFFKLNATLNRSAHALTSYQRLAELSPRQFFAGRAEVRRETDAMADFGMAWVYNPIGKMLVGISATQYQPYADRVVDLDTYIHLVRAQLEVRAASVPTEKLPLFLAEARAETLDPYSNGPFEWNAVDHTLSFHASSDKWKQWGTKVAVPAR